LNVLKKADGGEAMKCQCPKCKAEEGEQLGVIRDCVNVQEAKYLIYDQTSRKPTALAVG